MWLPTTARGVETGGAVAAQHAELAVGGEVARQRDQAERGEHDADVADDVVLARDDAAEVGVGVGAEHAGEDEHRDGGEGDEADEHARLAQQQAQLEAVRRTIVRSRPAWTAVGLVSEWREA